MAGLVGGVVLPLLGAVPDGGMYSLAFNAKPNVLVGQMKNEEDSFRRFAFTCTLIIPQWNMFAFVFLSLQSYYLPTQQD